MTGKYNETLKAKFHVLDIGNVDESGVDLTGFGIEEVPF
jgi:hypothetical protein